MTRQIVEKATEQASKVKPSASFAKKKLSIIF
jgi:hypothetical protein